MLETFTAVHPQLWKCYHALLDDLTDKHPYLSHLLPRNHSVFASCTLNVRGVTTRHHRDYLNFRPGACPVFTVSDFDPTKGGHLVLWDLKLVIEFPSGSLIIILSALIEHSNVPISQGGYGAMFLVIVLILSNLGETRFSFMQYSAAGLFRWVDNGFCTDKDLEEWGSWVESIANGCKCETLWAEGLACLGRAWVSLCILLASIRKILLPSHNVPDKLSTKWESH